MYEGKRMARIYQINLVKISIGLFGKLSWLLKSVFKSVPNISYEHYEHTLVTILNNIPDKSNILQILTLTFGGIAFLNSLIYYQSRP